MAAQVLAQFGNRRNIKGITDRVPAGFILIDDAMLKSADLIDPHNPDRINNIAAVILTGQAPPDRTSISKSAEFNPSGSPLQTTDYWECDSKTKSKKPRALGLILTNDGVYPVAGQYWQQFVEVARKAPFLRDKEYAIATVGTNTEQKNFNDCRPYIVQKTLFSILSDRAAGHTSQMAEFTTEYAIVHRSLRHP